MEEGIVVRQVPEKMSMTWKKSMVMEVQMVVVQVETEVVHV